MAKSKTLQAIVEIAGTLSPTLGKSIEEATGKLEGINVKALAVGAAVGGIAIATGAAVVKAGQYLADLGGQFDEATDAIRIGTGATGEALDALMSDFDEVYKSVPTTMEDASKAVADYNTRLGLTGEPLQEISKQALQVSNMLGDDLNGVIEGSSQAFQAWNIDAEKMGDAMDFVFKASQSTGVGFTELMEKTRQFAPQLQEMGYSFEDATALIGQMEKAGVQTDEVLAAMKKSVGTLAKRATRRAKGFSSIMKKSKTQAAQPRQRPSPTRSSELVPVQRWPQPSGTGLSRWTTSQHHSKKTARP
ncbi:phage tail tape measure protein [Tepidibacillus marianensis]|uniref:phage tail tape measure protein n=1 Tax=Tepidibacillus marianensis TaxID=3131995 RepID=UPI0030CD7E38